MPDRVDHAGKPRRGQGRWIERSGIRIRGGDHGRLRSHRVRDRAHQRHGVVDPGTPRSPTFT